MSQKPNYSEQALPSDRSEKNDRKSEHAEIKERSEAANDLKEGILNNEVRQQRQKQFESGKSGVTDKRFASAKSLLGDHAHGSITKVEQPNREKAFQKRMGRPKPSSRRCG